MCFCTAASIHTAPELQYTDDEDTESATAHTCSLLLHGGLHVGGADDEAAGGIHNHPLAWPLVQAQHLALPGHHILQRPMLWVQTQSRCL